MEGSRFISISASLPQKLKFHICLFSFEYPFLQLFIFLNVFNNAALGNKFGAISDYFFSVLVRWSSGLGWWRRWRWWRRWWWRSFLFFCFSRLNLFPCFVYFIYIDITMNRTLQLRFFLIKLLLFFLYIYNITLIPNLVSAARCLSLVSSM